MSRPKQRGWVYVFIHDGEYYERLFMGMLTMGNGERTAVWSSIPYIRDSDKTLFTPESVFDNAVAIIEWKNTTTENMFTFAVCDKLQ